jgi:hypothetical protein
MMISLLMLLASPSAHAEEPAPQPAKAPRPPVTRKAAPAKAAPAAPGAKPSAKFTPAPTTAKPAESVPTAESAPEASPTPTITPAPVPTPEPVITPEPVSVVPKHREIPREIPVDPPHEYYGKAHGLLGNFPIGPTVSILQIPHPLQVGLEGKFLDIAGFSFMYGMFPKLTISDVSVKLDSWDVRARWFPFRGSFFLGAAYGKQKLTGTKKQSISTNVAQYPTVDIEGKVELETPYLSPHLGWRWVAKSGFFYGLELGWQFALNASTTVSTDKDDFFNTQIRPYDTTNAAADYDKLRADVVDEGNKIGKIGLPHITLIQIGWYF